MYSKEEASKVRQQFWISFGRYMKPIPSAEGLLMNWVNYKTGVKHLYFKMDVGQHQAEIAITISHSDPDKRSLFFEKFNDFKMLLEEVLEEEWKWNADLILVILQLKYQKL